MHLDFITVGTAHNIDRTIAELSAKYLPFTFKKDDGKGGFIEGSEAYYQAQVIVREIRFFEAIFPEQHKDLILNTLFGDDAGKLCLFDDAGKKYEKYLWALRKMLKLQPIPENYDKSKIMPLYKAHSHFIGLGIKEDRKEDGKEML